MFRSKLMIWVAVLVLLVAGAGCAADLDRTVEETIPVTEQPAGETILDPEQPAGETDGFTITGWVTVDAYHYDEATGTYIHFYHHESSNLVTSIGFDWIEDQLGDSPSTDPAKWISLSLDTGTPGAAWTQIPAEIVAGGLTRAAGTYTSTGVGVWTIDYQFTATAGHTDVQLTGLQYAVSGDNNLMAANTFTPVTLANLDSLTITWTITLS